MTNKYQCQVQRVDERTLFGYIDSCALGEGLHYFTSEYSNRGTVIIEDSKVFAAIIRFISI